MTSESSTNSHHSSAASIGLVGGAITDSSLYASTTDVSEYTSAESEAERVPVPTRPAMPTLAEEETPYIGPAPEVAASYDIDADDSQIPVWEPPLIPLLSLPRHGDHDEHVPQLPDAEVVPQLAQPVQSTPCAGPELATGTASSLSAAAAPSPLSPAGPGLGQEPPQDTVEHIPQFKPRISFTGLFPKGPIEPLFAASIADEADTPAPKGYHIESDYDTSWSKVGSSSGAASSPKAAGSEGHRAICH